MRIDLESRGEMMVALNLGSDARYGKKCSDWRDI